MRKRKKKKKRTEHIRSKSSAPKQYNRSLIVNDEYDSNISKEKLISVLQSKNDEINYLKQKIESYQSKSLDLSLINEMKQEMTRNQQKKTAKIMKHVIVLFTFYIHS